MLKVCLVVDVEGFISFRQKNPEWTAYQNLKKIAVYLLRNLLYDGKGYEKIYNVVCSYKLPASFMLVGKFFKPKETKNFVEYGYHSYSHKPLTYSSDETARREVKNIYNAVSFSAPMNLIEDPLSPGRILRMLKKEGYKIALWGGPTIRDKYGKIVVVPPRKSIRNPVKVEGIKCIYISEFFDGRTSPEKIESIIREIEKNSKKDAVYCLTTHDFSNKNLENFKEVAKRLVEMKDSSKIKLITLKQLTK